MNWNYPNATLVARAVEGHIATEKLRLKKLQNILAGKSMGAATLGRQTYTPEAIQRLKDKIHLLTEEINQAEDFERDLRDEVARLADGLEAPGQNRSTH